LPIRHARFITIGRCGTGPLHLRLKHYRQAVYLDSATKPGEPPGAEQLAGLKAAGINIWAPPLFALLTVDGDGRLVASDSAKQARAAGLEIVAWTLERSGFLADRHPGFYYQGLERAVAREGDVLQVLDVLAREVGVRGVFSDWPATVSFYANCAGLP